jgi:phosphopantetheinyl transferase
VRARKRGSLANSLCLFVRVHALAHAHTRKPVHMTLVRRAWVPPPLKPAGALQSLWQDLEPGVVHLWRLCWSRVDLPLDWLSEDERAYAQQSQSARRRREFCTCRAAWRAVLARYYQPQACVPQSVALARTATGKPFLQNGYVRFNTSHTRDWAVLAVTGPTSAIGCDVEHLDRRIRDPLGLARRLGLDTFQAPAPDTLATLSQQLLLTWSEREAVAKALDVSLARIPATPQCSVVRVPVLTGQVLASIAVAPAQPVKRIEAFALDTLTPAAWRTLAHAQPSGAMENATASEQQATSPPP